VVAPCWSTGWQQVSSGVSFSTFHYSTFLLPSYAIRKYYNVLLASKIQTSSFLETPFLTLLS
jgi:hypothetical protein